MSSGVLNVIPNKQWPQWLSASCGKKKNLTNHFMFEKLYSPHPPEMTQALGETTGYPGQYTFIKVCIWGNPSGILERLISIFLVS